MGADLLEVIELGLHGLGFFCLEEPAGGDHSGTAFKFPDGADAIVKELKGLVELVGGNFAGPVIGEQEGVLRVTKRVG